MADFIRAIRFENTVHDPRLRRVLQCRVNCQAAMAAAPTAPAPAPAPAGGSLTTTVTSSATSTTLDARAAPATRAPLAATLRTGVKVSLRAPGPGRLRITATRGARVVARGAAVTTAAGRRVVTLRFPAGARKALRRARTVSLAIKATYTPPRGASVAQRLRLTLER
jgi:hypothetical protein